MASWKVWSVDGRDVSSLDHEDMLHLGKIPRLKRMFGFVSLIGFTCTLMLTWAAVYFSNFTALLDGGPVTLIYGCLFAWLGSMVTAASLAELASMMPTSGGQYHWTATLAPPRISVFLSWLTGWISILGWLANVTAAVFLAGTITQALVLFNYPELPYKRWQGTLMALAAVLVACIVNTFGARVLPHTEMAVLVLYIAGFFAVFVPFVVLAPHHDASFVFTKFSNSSNWNSDGLVWLIGLISSNLPFIGYDGPAHMAEEVENASIVVPWTMIISVVFSGVLGTGTVIAFLFCLGGLDDAINAGLETGFDFIQVFFNATNSYLGTSFMTAIIIALLTCTSFCALASASRQTWAFSRDRGLPFSGFLAHITKFCGLPMPLRSIMFSATVSSVISLINIGSTVAFNAIVSLTISALFISYLIPIVLILIKRLRGDTIAWGPWRMGSVGIAVNMCSIVFLLISTFFSFFPPARPVTAKTMNWSPVVLSGSLIFGLLWYAIRGRRFYNGPIVEAFGE